MNKALSTYLNALRGLAALLVVLSHLGQGRLDSAPFRWIHDLDLGHDAVILFFVLSGYVIAYSMERRPDARDFALARASRLLSTLVPLLVIAPFLAWLGSTLDPALYADPTAFERGTSFARDLLETLTFTQEFAFQAVTYYGDVPLWSLSYEAAFYLMFGLAFYMNGPWRIAAIALFALAAGPKILLLAPVWSAGWALYRWRDRFALASGEAKLLLAASLLGLALYLIGHARADQWLTGILQAHGIEPYGLRFSRHFMSDYLLGLVICAHLVAARALLDDGFAWHRGIAALANWLAERSFAIYLFHFPLLYLIAAVIGQARHGLTGGLIMLAGALGGSAALASISDLRKREWRALLERLWNRAKRCLPAVNLARNSAPHR